MSKKIGFIALLGWIISFSSLGQQVPFYNHNIINPMVFNPAYSGINGMTNFYFTRGRRFTGFGSGATTNTLTVDGNFIIPNSGFGVILSQRSVGIMNQLGAKLNYAYHLKINENNHLSFGINGGVLDNRIRSSAINVMQPNDPYLAGMKQKKLTYNFDFGLAYRWKNLNFGLAVPQLIGNKVKFTDNATRGYYRLARHFMGTLSYDFHFKSAPRVVLTPYFLGRYIIGAPFQYNGTIRVLYKNLGYLSVTYKSDYAVQFNLGFKLFNHLHLGYSFEYITGSIKNHYSGINHEIMVGYSFGAGKTKKVIHTDTLTVRVKDTSLEKENKQLKEKIKNLQDQIKDALAKRFQDSIRLAKMKKEAEENNSLREAPSQFYHFENTDGSQSPAGYYVVIGVYSKHKNTTKNIRRNKGDYPSVHYIINTQKNDYEYIIIKYTKDLKEALDTYNHYKESTGKDVWVLRYKMN